MYTERRPCRLAAWPRGGGLTCLIHFSQTVVRFAPAQYPTGHAQNGTPEPLFQLACPESAPPPSCSCAPVPAASARAKATGARQLRPTAAACPMSGSVAGRSVYFLAPAWMESVSNASTSTRETTCRSTRFPFFSSATITTPPSPSRLSVKALSALATSSSVDFGSTTTNLVEEKGKQGESTISGCASICRLRAAIEMSASTSSSPSAPPIMGCTTGS
mmetsp:Transcript_45294/g.69354  ORF Transcript_45294/g.69354 Transcript_45294/m.69354 type:complete len:218 (-) Transcript_45294:604-1257(-)